MHEDIDHILLTEEQIRARVRELASALNERYRGEEVLCVGILKGSVVFYSDLVRLLDFPVRFDFMVVSSYENATTSSGAIKIKYDLSGSIEGKNVLIIEDILDTGTTLFQLNRELKLRNPKSLTYCCLLDKPSRRTAEMECDFVGFQIPDEFVVGYGLDFDNRYRQFPFIGVLKPECYKK